MDIEEDKEYCIFYRDVKLKKILVEIKDELKNCNINLKIIEDKIKLKRDEVILSNGASQAEICAILRKKFKYYSYANVKVWCDGHLPIRKIVVGPSKDAEYMVNSINEFKKTKYWMQDIIVEKSKIPLRT